MHAWDATLRCARVVKFSMLGVVRMQCCGLRLRHVLALACVGVNAATGAASEDGRCSRPRKVYIDMGVNWCNTLELFRSLPKAWLPWEPDAVTADNNHRALADGSTTPWQVYGFEASPVILTYAEQCARALTLGQPLPISPVPSAGSGPDLLRLASRYNCTTDKKVPTNARYECIFQKVRGDLRNLREDPALTSDPKLLSRRVASAAACPSARTDAFTIVPAAAAAAEGVMKIFFSLEDLITGGAKTSLLRAAHRGMKKKAKKVFAVDVVRWLLRSFKPDDFVVLKMDIEGAEHYIVPELIAAGAAPLIDVFLWECHHVPGKHRCHGMEAALEKAGVNIVFREPYQFGDKRSEKRVRATTRRAGELQHNGRASNVTAAGAVRRMMRAAARTTALSRISTR